MTPATARNRPSGAAQTAAARLQWAISKKNRQIHILREEQVRETYRHGVTNNDVDILQKHFVQIKALGNDGIEEKGRHHKVVKKKD